MMRAVPNALSDLEEHLWELRKQVDEAEQARRQLLGHEDHDEVGGAVADANVGGAVGGANNSADSQCSGVPSVPSVRSYGTCGRRRQQRLEREAGNLRDSEDSADPDSSDPDSSDPEAYSHSSQSHGGRLPFWQTA